MYYGKSQEVKGNKELRFLKKSIIFLCLTSDTWALEFNYTAMSFHRINQFSLLDKYSELGAVNLEDYNVDNID